LYGVIYISIKLHGKYGFHSDVKEQKSSYYDVLFVYVNHYARR